ncbi:amino acid permease [Zeaxanthinibacter sp. PT1]|uniref:amino acid permease n=1 Tax=Zeaxanthinibacter TaxID=561554 RepID=UPI00234BE4D2|nr:amino acid permease [Zeaxanthinibacter sp. PT1]MDC6350080.1 amino acid permease [Zeaxanthinibacter sp. PT1]
MSENTVHTPRKFGTFLGVYTPSVLTILGLIMYLRFGWVVGNVGLGWTMVIVILASSITFITGLSASAIATNSQVGVGGEYFLVSRSLGMETGGAIGIPLYFCRILSVTFYSYGLAEAILIFWPADWGGIPSFGLQGLTAVFIISVALLSGKSAAITLKAQLPIMILVGLSIVALAVGVLSHETHAPLMNATYATTGDGGFWYVFAVFFPAVTGFTAGIGMSGDLKKPRKSIPRGTLGAVLTGALIYLLIPVLFAITGLLTIEQLTDEEFGLKTWTSVALFGGIIVIPAVWGAILSSTFGSILGGPRVLQALSMDGLAPKFLSKLSNTGQPTRATWISGAIALLAVSLGSLNTLAQLVSILFLTLYVIINFSAALEVIVAEPSYRPKIRVPWYISILGAAGAIGVMFLINPWACLLALLIVAGLYIWLRSRSLEQQWGDVSVGFWIKVARYALLQLKNRSVYSRNWRPLMLVFVKNVDKHLSLIKLAELLGQHHGILTLAHLICTEEFVPDDKRRTIETEIRKKIAHQGFQAFIEVHSVTDFHEGFVEIAKGHGLGGLRTNTILFDWSHDTEGQIKELRAIEALRKKDKNIILLNSRSGITERGKVIDIWWRGQQNNGDLMLMCAYLIKLNPQWEDAGIRILSVVRTKEHKTKLSKGIKKLLPLARIEASVHVIVHDGNFRDVLYEKSGESDMVFLGLPKGYEGDEYKVAKHLDMLCHGLRTTVFVQNNGMSHSIPILLKVGE